MTISQRDSLKPGDQICLDGNERYVIESVGTYPHGHLEFTVSAVKPDRGIHGVSLLNEHAILCYNPVEDPIFKRPFKLKPKPVVLTSIRL